MSFLPTLGPARPVCSSVGLKISKDPNLQGDRVLRVSRDPHPARSVAPQPEAPGGKDTVIHTQPPGSLSDPRATAHCGRLPLGPGPRHLPPPPRLHQHEGLRAHGPTPRRTSVTGALQGSDSRASCLSTMDTVYERSAVLLHCVAMAPGDAKPRLQTVLVAMTGVTAGS